MTESDAILNKRIFEFCAQIKSAIGGNVVVRLCPYQIGCTVYLAIDLNGDFGEASITVIESEVDKIPTVTSNFGAIEVECELIGEVKIFRFAEILLASLDLC